MNEISQLTTPCFLLDLDKLEQNIKDMADLCKANGKKLCPMVKTHKSAEIAAMQAEYGADSFLVGTLDEAEILVHHGYKQLVLPYPVAAAENIARVIALSKKAHIMLSFDGIDAAAQFDELLAQEALRLEYMIIIDCGLHRSVCHQKTFLNSLRSYVRFPIYYLKEYRLTLGMCMEKAIKKALRL